MRNLPALFFGAALISLSACAMKVDIEGEKMKVKSVVDQFAQAWEKEDMEMLSRIMAHDADMVNYGTDAAEHFVGWEAFKQALAKMFPSLDKTRITVKDQVIKVHPSGAVAWFSQVWDWDLMVEGKRMRIPNCRFTGVLEMRNGSWVFVQFHNSVPAAG